MNNFNEEVMERRIYSLNMVAYLYMHDCLESYVGRDEVSGKIYFVYEEEIDDLIEQYKKDSHIQNFCHMYSVLRQKMRQER